MREASRGGASGRAERRDGFEAAAAGTHWAAKVQAEAPCVPKSPCEAPSKPVAQKTAST